MGRYRLISIVVNGVFLVVGYYIYDKESGSFNLVDTRTFKNLIEKYGCVNVRIGKKEFIGVDVPLKKYPVIELEDRRILKEKYALVAKWGRGKDSVYKLLNPLGEIKVVKREELLSYSIYNVNIKKKDTGYIDVKPYGSVDIQKDEFLSVYL